MFEYLITLPRHLLNLVPLIFASLPPFLPSPSPSLSLLVFHISPAAMSRRRSTSTMGPPPDRDVVMGPPPIPAPLPQQSVQQKPKDSHEITEKYKKLKRRYFELEEVQLLLHTAQTTLL